MINCVIIDDDDFAIESLEKILINLKDIYSINIIGKYTNSVQALNELENKRNYNLIFVDYEMPGYNGIEFIKKLNNDVAVIFVTSHTEKTEDIINEVNVKGFLSKPFLIENLEKILKKDNLLSNKNLPAKIEIKNGKSKSLYFKPDEIYYIKSEGKYKNIHGYEKDEPIEKDVEISMQELLKILSPYGFEKVHKSYIVNINHIRKKIKNDHIVLTNDKRIDIGESAKKSFIDRLKNIFSI